MPAGKPGSGGRGTIVVPGPTVSYTTNFSLTENPMSEGGRWRNGLTHGLDWSDLVTVSGSAYGTQVGGAPSGPPYNDSLACLSGFSADHSASQTVLINGSGDPGLYHEAEVLLRWDIAAHVARGYELNYAWDGAYCEIVAWNGSLNDYTPLTNTTPPRALVTGDVLTGSIQGNVINWRLNGAIILTYTDTRVSGGPQWTTGNPGIGAWRRGGTGLPPRLLSSHFEAFSL